MKTCSVCEKEIEENGQVISAIGVNVTNDASNFTKEFLQKQMGEYQLNTYYYICCECLLRGLGVKPQ